jgi:serine/threonine protein kinase/tetratricopeptide (TPR) repeat protein
MPEQSIFIEALEKYAPAELAAYLDQACAGDSELRKRVERLLQRYQGAGSFLESPPPGLDVSQLEPPISEGPGSIIGPYKLLEQIGEGGMGVVFMAEQTHPVQRKVALKIVKPGMDTKQVIARFEAERQALALMDHPNIARVLDAGTTGEESGRQYAVGSRQPSESRQESAESDSSPPAAYRRPPASSAPPPTAYCQPPTPSAPPPTAYRLPPTTAGRPYFVMELVRGVPLTEFCDQHKLTIRERLELFINVCQAVQHAHQKGIIHRDLKPTNVLVTLHDTKPVVKVIDFGVAKATGQKLTEKTLFTGLTQMIGTPLYMSPEQAEMSGLDVDTRSDIYSLGVLLYELLTGTTPFDSQRLKRAAFDEMRRIIRKEEPPRPSTRISSLSRSAPKPPLPPGEGRGEGESSESAEVMETANLTTTIADRRRIDPRHLSRLFQGELDWIVMKCLEKDRNRRYETASALADDVERYLCDGPVQACPPSRRYLVRKLIRRHKALATGIIFALLFVFVVGGVVVEALEWALRDQANRISALECDERGASYLQDGRFAEAEAAFRDAIRIQPDYFQAHTNLGRILYDRKRYDEAELALASAIQLQPSDWMAHFYFGLTLLSHAQSFGRTPSWDLIVPEMLKAIDLSGDGPYHSLRVNHVATKLAKWPVLFDRVARGRPNEPALWLGRARYRAQCCQWADAMADYSKVIYHRPLTGDETVEYAYLLVLLNDTNAYVRFCQELLGRIGEPHDALESFQMARAFSAAPQSVASNESIVQWASYGAETYRDAWYPHALGLAHYRAGHFELAIENLRESNKRVWDTTAKSQNWLVLAMCQFQLGKIEEANQCLATAENIIAEALPEKTGEPVDVDPPDWIPIQVLLREAESLLNGGEATQQSEKNAPSPDPKTSPDNSGASGGGVSHQARHAVEIGVVAGDVGEPLSLHDGNRQGIVGEQSVLDAQRGSGSEPLRLDGKHLNMGVQHILDRSAEASQFSDKGRLPLQSVDHFRGPAKQLFRFQHHQPMYRFADDMGGGETDDIAGFDSAQEIVALRTQNGMRGKMIDEDIRVQKDGRTGWDGGQVHGASFGSNSGESAKRSIVSASPVQPMIPYPDTSAEVAGSTVTRTFSCSASGSGWASFNVPFSYVASTVIVII